jgi:hypothetical protein
VSQADDESLYEELSRLNNELVNAQRVLAKKNARLEAALARVRRLEGLLPICMHCHRIRDDADTWRKLEEYLAEYADVAFTHCLCPECLAKHYPDEEP